MSCLAKSTQEPLHLQSLIDARYNSGVQDFTKHCRETCLITLYHHKSPCPCVLWCLFCLRQIWQTPATPAEGKEKSSEKAWEVVQFFKLFIYFPSIYWTNRSILDCAKYTSFSRLEVSFSSDYRTQCMLNAFTSCRPSLGYATRERESPTAAASLSDITALPESYRAACLGETLLLSFVLGHCCMVLCGHIGQLQEVKCW